MDIVRGPWGENAFRTALFRHEVSVIYFVVLSKTLVLLVISTVKYQIFHRLEGHFSS